MERHHGNDTVGTAPWEQHHGNGTVGTAPWDGSNFFIISMIQMIYFDGSMGTGGEGQQFLLSISKNILHLMIQIIYFDGSVGTGAFGLECGDRSMGTGA